MAIVETLLFTLAGVWQGIRQDFNLLELLLVGLLLWKKPAFRTPLWTRRVVRCLARRHLATCMLVGLLAVGFRVALLPLLPEPKPVVADEFSHLLLADTLLHGRLSNPTHPFWHHFESLHIVQQPHYVSDYLPGQAIFLAAGRLFMGDPWAGVLLLSGLFCGVLCWALQGWLPFRWALCGALLAVLRFSLGSYWVNGFHGGFLAATGGALVLGACGRLRRRVNVPQAILFALGLAVLMGSRPLEGFAYSLPFVLHLLWISRKAWVPNWRVLIPVIVAVGVAISAIGYYNAQVTGHPTITVYQLNQQIYGWPLALAWVTPQPIVHRHIEMARYYRYELDEYAKVNSPLHFVQYLTFRVQEYWRFFLGPTLTVPLFLLPRLWRKRRLQIIFAAFGSTFAAIMVEGWASPHYLAPATAIVWLLLLECFRHLAAVPRGRSIALALPLILMLVLTLRIAAQNLHLPYTQAVNYQSWCCKVQGNYNKARLMAYLDSQPGRHLVFVRPKTDENNLLQWIYNDADIDQSHIVWARDLGPADDDRLAHYFGDRQVWVVDPNVEPASIVRYP